MALTRSGIAYDLTKSPYKVVLSYSGQSIIYTFSSQLYKDIFLRKLEENREATNALLSKRFGIQVEENELCDLKLYAKVEKRGYLIETDSEVMTCREQVKLNGGKVIQIS